ncbi:MAG: putative porin [Bacteroidales bacterium]|nr:putative porin [Bacteroidales bacterium]
MRSGTITERGSRQPPGTHTSPGGTFSAPDNLPEKPPKTPNEEDDKPKVEQLDSYAFDKEIVKNRLFTWQVNRYINTPVIGRIDTLINDRRRDLIYRKDVGAIHLGVSGSAAMPLNYFQRKQHDFMYALTPFDEYFVTPDNLNFYNTRSPFTRFTYSGNPFSSNQFEELNLEALNTQNITPEWNFGILYRHFGGKGLLANESTDVRNFTLFTSYSGRNYLAQAGYIYNSSNNKQNGGIIDDSAILDTTIDVRTISVNLTNAREKISTNTFFLVHSYGIPLKFLYSRAVADSLGTGEGSIVYFGNSLEYTNTKRMYYDNITDEAGRTFYNNNFFINPTISNDSIHSTLFDARLFMTLQPFAPDFLISKVTGGIGYRNLSNYGFQQAYYIRPVQNNKQNNFYLYGHAQGNFRQYFAWSAFARYYLTGYNMSDLYFSADASLSLFPIKHGIHLWGRFSIDNRTPDYFLQNYYSNHLQWRNNFDKTIETKVEAGIRIPHWDLNASIGNSLLKSPVFFDTTAMPRQTDEIVNILSVLIEKNFKLWLVHLDNRVLFQVSSAQDIVPLPALALNSALYIEMEAVKNVLTAQIGGDMYYNTRYYTYGYNPAAGAFHLQRNRETGNCPTIDIFLNVKWKKATFYVKYVNAFEGWPNSDYFSASHYIKPQTVLKFGLSWPFYL